MRRRHKEILGLGAEVVAVGTGDKSYAASFVRDEEIPFPVLVDDAAEAAGAASVRRVGPIGLFNPRSYPGSLRAYRSGHRVHRSGSRVTQLGATFVVGPGNVVRYEHLDAHSADHAPIEEVLAALER